MLLSLINTKDFNIHCISNKAEFHYFWPGKSELSNSNVRTFYTQGPVAISDTNLAGKIKLAYRAKNNLQSFQYHGIKVCALTKDETFEAL